MGIHDQATKATKPRTWRKRLRANRRNVTPIAIRGNLERGTPEVEFADALVF
jgi:hypothetical protein